MRGIPETCGDITKYFFNPGQFGKVGKVRDAISKICDALEVPSKLSGPVLEQYVDLVGATFLTSHLGIRSNGLINSFGNRFDVEDIPTSATDWLGVFVPRTVTPAARFLSDFLKAWRKAQGDDHFDANGNLVREPIKQGERVTLRMFEVSHFALVEGELVRTPVRAAVAAGRLPAGAGNADRDGQAGLRPAGLADVIRMLGAAGARADPAQGAGSEPSGASSASRIATQEVAGSSPAGRLG